MLSGAPFGTSINTGMKIVGLDGKEYEIKEIYIGHGNVTKPSLSVEDGAEFAILIIDAGDWNLEKSRRAIKKEKVIALELK
jgi:hypothetical protein